ncbi:BrnA antitoxin family protein [Lichenibacterium dinghuense]|uniref:BrnA antitoxin family protein n=1 Tax=Lichenibacterium dinghuense TaxID=2895977 RepID=UPI001F1AFDA8|nr:BrnA antitoxin family protein [Lichenibacterium sp. 6Y81]
MKGEPLRRDGSEHLTPEQAGELERLASLPEEEIDTRDIPEQRDWSGARRGLFFRPVKQQLTLRLDADLVAWFKARAPEGKGYQTGVNSALRAYVEQHGSD